MTDLEIDFWTIIYANFCSDECEYWRNLSLDLDKERS